MEGEALQGGLRETAAEDWGQTEGEGEGDDKLMTDVLLG